MKPFESRWERTFPYVLGTLLGLSIAMFVASIVMLTKAKEGKPSFTYMRGGGLSEEIEEERKGAIVEATRRASPTVVSITALRAAIVHTDPLLSYQWFERFFFNRRIRRLYTKKYSIIGSGVIVNPGGSILTNEHVIRDSEEIYITLNDGAELRAELLGSAPEFDLALLKVEAENLPYAVLGDSDRLKIGEWVIAIGSPFGYLLNDTQPTVTVGVVSALHRDVKSNPETDAVFKNMIQTDAAINPGNSGGPLVSSVGEVVGINTFIFSTGNGSNLGIGFAIPVNSAKMVIDEIARYGRVRDVWTGLEVRELTPEIVQALNLDSDLGLFVERITSDSPAEISDVRAGDVIVEVNGQKVLSVQQANRAIFGLRVGDIVHLVIRRDGSSISIDIELTERPKSI